MNDRSRALLAMGVLLVSTPIWAPYLDLTGSEYVYEQTPIEIHDGQIDVEPRAGAPAPAGDIACLGVHESRHDRLCYFERALLTGNVTVDTGNGPSGASPSGPKYLVFGPTGAVYERTFENRDDGRSELGLRRVDPATALAAVATDVDDRPRLARVVENDGIRTEERILRYHSIVVSVDESYYLVYQDGTSQFLTAKPGVERGIEAILVTIGAYVLFSAGRNVDRHD